MNSTLIIMATTLAAGVLVEASMSGPEACSIPLLWRASVEQPHHDDDDHEKLPKKELGKKEIGGYSVLVNQLGDVKAGEEAVFLLTVTGAGKPKAIRGWVGIESGARSIRSQAQEEDGVWHLHHEVSKPMPANSKLWIEIETSRGKQSASFDLKH